MERKKLTINYYCLLSTVNIVLICVDSDTITFVKLQSTMLQGIERYLKQAIVDKNASVSSAALVSALVGREKFFGYVMKHRESMKLTDTSNT